MNKSVFISLIILVLVFQPAESLFSGEVHVITVNTTINPVSSKYIKSALHRAENVGAECLVIQLDTPGGLMTSMREIIKEILNADVPVAIYIAPAGSQAASAGVFITLSAHFAFMAPGTNIGAAHPVMMGGGGIGGQEDSSQTSIMNEKVTNDAVAYIKSLAEKRGRNVEWAEKSVRESASITEKEALELNVIDSIAANIQEILAFLDGKTCEISSGKKTLSTEDARVIYYETPLQYRILYVLSHPNVAYILLMLGFYGLFFELSNPGAILPGVLGGIFLILAFFSLQILPVNFAGVALIIFALILFLLEVKVTSYGMLTLGGIVSMILGSMMLFESPEAPQHLFQVSLKVVIPIVVFTAAFVIFAFTMAYRAHQRKVSTGAEGLIGETGVTRTSLNPEGKVAVHGELWNARCEHHLKKGAKVRITGVDGMVLIVEAIQ